MGSFLFLLASQKVGRKGEGEREGRYGGGDGSPPAPHDAHLAPRLVNTFTQAHDILQLAHVRRQGKYVRLAMRGDQLLGERLERRGVDVSDCYFQSETDKRPRIAGQHISAQLQTKRG